MQAKVRIMMATFNGERFLREQLDSIINQTYKHWSLIVQDDGSKDRTWEILKEFQDKDNRIAIRRSPEEKHGAYYNFHSIANQEKQSGIVYDYYMFSDQDDVWDADKIERMLNRIEKETIDKPALCYADMIVIDENGKKQIDSLCESQGLFYINKESLFFSHIIYGCNTLMNRAAFFSVPIIDTTQEWVSVLSHDNLYAKFSGILGSVVFCPETTMRYRRHGSNVTSQQSYGFGLKRIIGRAIRIQDLAKDHARTYSQSLIAISLLKNQGAAFELRQVEECIRRGGLTAIRIVNRQHIGWGNRVKDLSRRLVLLCGIYKKYLSYI